MLVYDKAYRAIREQYLLPLSNYSIKYTELKVNNIKELLINSQFNSVYKDNNDYLFYFENDTLIKAILGDIQLFFIKGNYSVTSENRP